jgi:hypothetical protein
MFSGAHDVDIGHLGAGGRLGLLLDLVELFVFAHLSAADATAGWGDLWDAGVAVDLRRATSNVGVHFAREQLNGKDQAEAFWAFGAHFEIRWF